MTENILKSPVEAAQIANYLPHRYPFLLVDRVISMPPEERAWSMSLMRAKASTFCEAE